MDAQISQTIAQYQTVFAQKPWLGVTAADLQSAHAVPTMLKPEEGQLYHWLGKSAKGVGAVVDLGVFAGGSSARLLSGLSRSGYSFHLHGYDRFTASEEARALHLSPKGISLTTQEDILPLATEFLAPWAENVTLNQGEIADLEWTGGRVELLVVDAAKSTLLADHIAEQFFSHLIPGKSLVIHQDFLHIQQPWLAIQMARLADYFTPLGLVAKDCVVFLNTAPVTNAALRRARTDGLSDEKLMSEIRGAAKLYADMIPKDRFTAMIKKLRANPGARVSWQMWQ